MATKKTIDTSTTEGKIAVMKAAHEGRKIEVRGKSESVWADAPTPTWNWRSCDYRVKEEPRTLYALVRENGTIARYLVSESEANDEAACLGKMCGKAYRVAKFVEVKE